MPQQRQKAQAKVAVLLSDFGQILKGKGRVE